MSKLWTVEYHPGKGQYHYETLRGRLKKNCAQILHEGDVRGKGWVLIGLTESAVEAARYCEAFERRLKSAGGVVCPNVI